MEGEPARHWGWCWWMAVLTFILAILSTGMTVMSFSLLEGWKAADESAMFFQKTQSLYGHEAIAACGKPPRIWHHFPGQAYLNHKAYVRCVKDWTDRKWTWMSMFGHIHLFQPILHFLTVMVTFVQVNLPRLMQLYRAVYRYLSNYKRNRNNC